MSGTPHGRFAAARRVVRSAPRAAWTRLRGSHRGWSRRSVGALAAVLLVVAVTVGGLAQLRVDTGIGSFLPRGDPAQAALEEKARSFGGDPVVVLLETREPRAALRDDQLQRLLRLEGDLAELPGAAEVYGPATVLNQIAKTGQNLVARISGRRDGLRSAAEAEARARGADDRAAAEAGVAALGGFDQRYGGLLISALPVGLPTLGNPRFVGSVVFGDGDAREPSLPSRAQWKAIVPAPNAVAVLVRPGADADQSANADLVSSVRDTVARSGIETTRVTVSGVPAVTAALSDQAQRELPLLGALALVLVGGLYVLVPWTPRRRARLRPLLAALGGTVLTLAAFGWVGRPVSLGVVAFLPVLLGIGSDFPLYLAQPARRRRVLVAALAGAAAFAALAISPLPFVRELGVALALGIVATVGVALAMRRWLDVLPPDERAGSSGLSGPAATLPWSARAGVLVVTVAVAAMGWAALPNLPVQADPQRLAEGLPALEQAAETERVLGASGEVNVVLRGPDVTSAPALAWTRQAEQVVSTGFGDRLFPITTVSGLLEFLGPNPDPEQIQAGLALMPSYLTDAVLQRDGRASLLVLGIELQDLEGQRELLDGVRSALPPPPPGYTADVVGLPVAAVSAYDAVAGSRVTTNVLAVVLAGLVLVAGLRERSDALRGVLAVAIAGGWVLAGIWLFAGTLSPLTVAIGALVAATGCEFTVMLADARRSGSAWIARSVALAAAAAVLGYLTLAGSRIAVLRDFGVLLAAGVLTSCLAASLVVGVLLPPRRDPDTPTAPRTEGRPERLETSR